jgi:hypothetical protein
MKDKITIEQAKELLADSEFDHVYVDFDSNVFTFSAEYNAAEDEVETSIEFIGQLCKYTKKEIRQFLYSYE